MMNEAKSGGDEHDDEGTRSYGSAMIPLPADFTPSENDVLVGRGKMCRTWEGNIKFRELVASRLDEYSAATSKLEKSALVTQILFEIRTRSPKGGFVKRDPLTNNWYEVGDFVARERVTQCFRDALHGKYRSSNTSKKQRRKEELRRAKEAPASKKLKTAPEQSPATSTALRIMDPPPSLQPQVAGLPSMLLQSGLPATLPLESRAARFDQPIASRLDAGFSASQVSTSLMPPLTGQQQSPNPFNTPSSVPSLEQQLMALQRLNQVVPSTPLSGHSGEQPMQGDGSYPSRWFRVNSGESLFNPLSDAASAHTQVVPISSLANQQFAQLHELEQAQARRSSAVATAVPSLPFAYGEGDDNPFEPVPIAENISRRNSQNKAQPKPSKET